MSPACLVPAQPLRRALLSTLALGLLFAAPCALAAPRTVSVADEGTPERVVQRALRAALMPDDDKGFAAYLLLLHPDTKPTDKAVEQLHRYSWKRFRRQEPDYVLGGTPEHFVIARQDPAVLEESTQNVRLFVDPVAAPAREHATPVRLQRSGAAWFITSNSL